MCLAGVLTPGAAYQVLLATSDGRMLERRDPYARATEYDSSFCYVDDAKAFKWEVPWISPPYEKYLIYEVN